MALVFLAPLLFCCLTYDQLSFLGEALHSDILLPADFFWDLTHRAAAWRDFQLPRVPSLVPDLAVYGLVQLTTGSWRIAHLAYGVFAFTSLTFLAGVIIAKIARTSVMAGARAFLLAALPILGIELLLTTASQTALHFWIFLPVSHGGSFILGTAGLCLAWACLDRPSAGRMALLGLLALAGTASDKLFLISFAAPLAAAVAHALYTGRIKTAAAARMIVVAAGGMALGPLLDRALVRQPDPFTGMLNLRSLSENALAFFKSPFYPLAHDAPITALLCFALPLAGFALVRPVWRKARGAGLDGASFWWLAAAAAVGGTIGALAMVYADVHMYRYAAPLLWWPVILLAAALARTTRQMARGSAALAGMAAVVAGVYLSEGPHLPRILTWQDPLASCLVAAQQEYGLRAGLGEYLFARYLSVLSDRRLQVEQIEEHTGSPYYMLNDPYWYRHDIHDQAHLPRFNFIVMTPHPDAQASADLVKSFGHGMKGIWENSWAASIGMKDDVIRGVYGPPDRLIDCPGTVGLMRHRSARTTVWIYDNANTLSKRVTTAPDLLARQFLADRRPFCIPPYHIRNADHLMEAGALKVVGNSPNGAALWGPYIDLPPGRLTLSMTYRLDAGAPASWGIVREGLERPAVPLYAGPLAPTAGAFRTVAAEVNLPDGAHDFQVVVHLGDQGVLRLKGVGLAPADGPGASPCEL